MNPLRFRSLRGERDTQYGILPFATLAAVALLCVSAPAPAAEDEKSDGNLTTTEQCQKDFYSGENSIFKKDDRNTLRPEFDPNVNCERNKGGETLSHNATVLDKNMRLGRGIVDKPMAFPEMQKTGACRLAYEAVERLFRKFADEQREYCDNLNAKWKEANHCGGLEKACKKEYETLRDLNKDYAAALTEQKKRAGAYLESIAKAAATAKDKYQYDLDKITQAMDEAKLPVKSTDKTAPKTTMVDKLAALKVKPSNGNITTQTGEPAKALEEYYKLLKGEEALPVATHPKESHAPKSLIQEEELAAVMLKTFHEKMNARLTSYRDSLRQAYESFSRQLAQIDKNGSTNGSQLSQTLKGITPAAAGAGSLAEKMVKGNGSSSGGSTPSVSGGSSRAPVAEAAAVAGLGALAAKSFGSASSPAPAAKELPAAEFPATKSGGEKAEVSNFGDRPGGGKAAADRAVAADAGATPDKAEAAHAGAEPGVYSGGGFSDGSSRSISSGKKRGATMETPAVAATVEAGGAGTADGFGGSFAAHLEPKPSTKSAGASPGAEVANLLGQMKNLFNFDEGSPTGGPAGAGPNMGGTPPALGNSDPNTPVADGGEAPSPEGEEAATVAEQDDHGGSTEATIHRGGLERPGNPFGRTDMSLFARVRQRHHRCMERGLVLYGLKERVE